MTLSTRIGFPVRVFFVPFILHAKNTWTVMKREGYNARSLFSFARKGETDYERERIPGQADSGFEEKISRMHGLKKRLILFSGNS